MPRFLLTITFFSMMLCGCASGSNDRTDALTNEIQNSPEIEKIDRSLDELTQETKNLEAEYAEIEKIVLANTKFDGENQNSKNQLAIYINENSVIIIDDRPLSKNECASYLDKVLPRLCSPAPVITIHDKADYDIAASILQMIYEHGCTDVKF